MKNPQPASNELGEIAPLLLVFLGTGTEVGDNTPCSVKLISSYDEERDSYNLSIEKNFHGERDSFQFAIELIRETLFLTLIYSSEFLGNFRPTRSYLIIVDDEKKLSQKEMTDIREEISILCQEWLDSQEIPA